MLTAVTKRFASGSMPDTTMPPAALRSMRSMLVSSGVLERLLRIQDLPWPQVPWDCRPLALRRC